MNLFIVVAKIETHKAKLTCPAGQPLLLPLTQSLYVNGTIASVDKVIVDIGTGYYVEVWSRTLNLLSLVQMLTLSCFL